MNFNPKTYFENKYLFLKRNRMKKLFILFLLIGFWSLILKFTYLPLRENNEELISKIENFKQENEIKKKEIDYFKSINDINDQIVKPNTFLPKDKKEKSALVDLENLLKDNELVLNSMYIKDNINFFQEELSNTLRSFDINLTLEGDYTNIYKFILELENYERLTSINKIELNGGINKDDIIDCNLEISFYWKKS